MKTESQPEKYKYFRIVIKDTHGKSNAIYLYDVNISSVVERISALYPEKDYEIMRLTVIDSYESKIPR